MIRKPAVILLLFFLTIGVHAQQQIVDSLLTKLKYKNADTTQLKLLVNLTEAYLSVSAADAIVTGNKAIRLAEKINSSKSIGAIAGLMGEAYFYQDDFDNSLKYFNMELESAKKIGKFRAIASAYNNLGIVSGYTDNYKKALEYYQKSLAIKQENGDSVSISPQLNNIGVIYEQQLSDYAKALEYYKQALRLAYKAKNYEAVVTYLNNFGDIYRKWQKQDQAVEYYFRAIELADSIGYQPILRNAYEGLYKSYATAGKYAKALHFHEMYMQVKDSIFQKDRDRALAELQVKYETETKEKLIVSLNKEKQQQLTIIYVAFFSFLIIFFFSLVLFHSYRQKQQMNAKLRQQKEDINDSIYYASRIQKAVLTPKQTTEANLGEHFILMQPRDIVGGDFYWVKRNENFVAVAVADCTGHGVPGGFMSMLGMAYLDDIFLMTDKPKADFILNELRSKIKSVLNQTGKAREQKDGMDLSLCILDKKTNQLEFAGAHQSLYIVRKMQVGPLRMSDGNSLPLKRSRKYNLNDKMLTQLRGDIQPIGISAREVPFQSISVRLEKNDTVYMFTDGYVDQVGGRYGDKFLVKNFKKLLLDIVSLPMQEQGKRLQSRFQKWMGKRQQVDDVLVMGFRIDPDTF